MPEDDKDWLSDLEELEEVEDNLEEEIKCLIEEAEEPVPDLEGGDEPEPTSVVEPEDTWNFFCWIFDQN